MHCFLCICEQHVKQKKKKFTPVQDPDGSRARRGEAWPVAVYQFLVKWCDQGDKSEFIAVLTATGAHTDGHSVVLERIFRSVEISHRSQCAD